MPARRLQQPQPKRRRHAAYRPRRLTRRRILAIALGAVIVCSVSVAVLTTMTETLGDNVPRVPGAFDGVAESNRPPASDGETFLLVGTDSRSDLPTTGTAARAASSGDRSDVLMIARLAEDGQSAAVVSIPRDSWVDIPGHGRNKINAAYAFGGPSLLIRTVENLTGLHVDHFAVIDFAGFQAVVDSVGGIDVGISAATSNEGVRFHQGVNHLDGAQALAYVRQRYGLADGDLDRAQRQQNAMRAVLTQGGLDRRARRPRWPVPAARCRGPVRQRRRHAEQRRPARTDAASCGTCHQTACRSSGRRSTRLGTRGRAVGGLSRPDLSPTQLWDALRRGTVAGYAEQHAADALGPVTR